ncbi:hypothetical protein GS504_05810 [Rhodococcus hoagii]|nr:hypothetical protein [Prescottella equi]
MPSGRDRGESRRRLGRTAAHPDRRQYEAPKVRLFSSARSTPGAVTPRATSARSTGPADSTAYFDTSFFQLLVDRYGANAGPLAQEYVVAHEFGHHIQNRSATSAGQTDPRGAASLAVRTELQADCYAPDCGRTTTPRTNPPRQLAAVPGAVDRPDVRDALSAASAVATTVSSGSAGARSPRGVDARVVGAAAEVVRRAAWTPAGPACDTYAGP